jgi:O-antigen ligase
MFSVLFFFIVLYPFASLLPFVEPYILGRLVVFHWIAAGGMLRVLAYAFGKRVAAFRVSNLFRILAAFLGYAFILGVFRGERFAPSTFGALLFFLGAGVVIFAGRTETVRDRIAALLTAMGGVVLVNEAFALLGGRSLAVFGHPHFQGNWILVALPCLLYRFVRSESFFRKTATAVIAIVLFGILFTGSRSRLLPWVAAANLVAVLGFLSGPGIRRKTAFAAFAALSGAFFWIGRESLLASLNDRIFIWKNCLSHWRAVPFFGTGPGGFETFYQNVLNGILIRDPEMFLGGETIGVEWAHNEWLHDFVEYGFPGLSLVILATGVAGRLVYRFAADRDPRFLFYLGLVNAAAVSLFSFPLRMPASGMLCFILAVLLAAESPERQGVYAVRIRFRPGRSWNFILLEAGVLCLLAFFVVCGRETLYLVSLSRGIRHLNDPAGGVWLEKSLHAHPDSELARFALGKYHLDRGRFDEAEYYFRGAVEKVPGVGALFGLAVALDMNGKHEQAFELYEKLKRIAPDFYPVAHNLDVLSRRLQSGADRFRLLDRDTVPDVDESMA